MLNLLCIFASHKYLFMSKQTEKKQLVIIGGGFGGLQVMKNIDKRQWDVTLIDRNNYHSFAPLFYQVASAALEPSDISFPLRREMRRYKTRGCQYEMGDVERVDVAKKIVYTQFREIAYDVLVIAAGTTNNFFGNNALRDHVYTLKSVGEAIRCRNAVLENLERASLCPDPIKRRAMLTFTVVGAGPTGVEVAGALGEMKRFIINRDYPRLNPEELRVILCEGSDRVLRTMSERSSEDALTDLRELNVDVQLGRIMQEYDGHTLRFTDGENIHSETVIWTAGIVGTPIPLEGTEVAQGRDGRFIVDEFNKVVGLEDVYAVGDISKYCDERFPNGCPQLAQPALQQGKNLALNLNKPKRNMPFSYNDKGSMATIGRNRAVVDMGKIHFGGWFAWIAWMAVHLMTLMGMRNKVVVLLNWIWNYWGFTTSLRLIMKSSNLPIKK